MRPSERIHTGHRHAVYQHNREDWEKDVKKHTVIGLLLLLSLSVPWARAETITIPGTGACEVVLGELAAAFNSAGPGREVIVAPSTGSGGGISAVLKGEADLARVARPLKQAEIDQGLTYLVFAKDAVIFAVGSKVSVRELTRSQLVNIFSGNLKNWTEAGGGPAPIRLLVREPQDSSLVIIKEHIQPFDTLSFDESAKLLYHDHEMVQMLKKHATAIGWLTRSSLSADSADIHAVALDGIAPTADNILGGRYPLVAAYAFVYRESRLQELARQFIAFVFSEPGRRLLQSRGILPVDKR
jgi:phosphate transport system substrate-binding protein